MMSSVTAAPTDTRPPSSSSTSRKLGTSSRFTTRLGVMTIFCIRPTRSVPPAISSVSPGQARRCSSNSASVVGEAYSKFFMINGFRRRFYSISVHRSQGLPETVLTATTGRGFVFSLGEAELPAPAVPSGAWDRVWLVSGLLQCREDALWRHRQRGNANADGVGDGVADRRARGNHRRLAETDDTALSLGFGL